MSDIVILNLDTPSVQYLCQKDRRLAKIINMVGPISYIPHNEDSYSFLVHEIIEQMLSIKAGQKIFNRLLGVCDGHIVPESIHALSIDQIHDIGTSNSKAECIYDLTCAMISGDLCLNKLEEMSDQKVIETLTKIRGIGKWTAKMYLIFVLDRPDILPSEDGAFLQAYRWAYKTNDCSEAALNKKCQKWKPYSSIAARYMYRALDMGLTKEPFHLYK